MSQRRQKKQLSTLENVSTLSDQELREALKSYDQSPGPITDSTRNLYRKKLASLMETVEEENIDADEELSTSQTRLPLRGKASDVVDFKDDDDESTSDEDYIAHEEDEDDEDEEDEDEDEDEAEEVEEDENIVNQLEEDIKLSNLSNLSMESDILTTSMAVGTNSTPDRIARGIQIVLISFLVAVISYYLWSSRNNGILEPLKQYKTLTRQLLLILFLSPTGYIAYKVFIFFKKRRYLDLQKQCDLVNDALELLQSPDNPKGLMPILHIRDTLLTPAERKDRKIIGIWDKAVNFIEKHESRVKIELVNIDGEDFRAWKWIGSRKL